MLPLPSPPLPSLLSESLLVAALSSHAVDAFLYCPPGPLPSGMQVPLTVIRSRPEVVLSLLQEVTSRGSTSKAQHSVFLPETTQKNCPHLFVVKFKTLSRVQGVGLYYLWQQIAVEYRHVKCPGQLGVGNASHMGSLPSVAESSIGQSFDSVGVSLKLASGCQRQR